MTINELLELYDGNINLIEINIAANKYCLRQAKAFFGLEKVRKFAFDESTGFLLITVA